MKEDERLHNDVRRAMECMLSGVREDPFMAQRVLRGEKTVMKKKITYVSVLVAAMLLSAAVALAAGIYEWVKPKMDQAADILIGTEWEMKDKLKLIDLLVETELISEDNDLYQICREPDQSLEDREQAANQLIDSVCGELLRSQLNPSVLQQEEFLSPDLETVFTLLYRSQNVEASDQEIAEAYRRWEGESDLFTSVEEITEPAELPTLTEEDVRSMADSMLSEIYNFNKAERAATKVEISYLPEHQIWIVQFCVKANDLRPALREEWITSDHDDQQGIYAWTRILTAEGRLEEGSSLEEYEWNHLIPRDGYPQWGVWEDDLRSFLYCTTEERAAFSAQYKPIVDTFLSEHPDIANYFEETTYGYAEMYDQTPYMITRQAYGIPDDGKITEIAAIAAAKQAYLNAGLEGVSEEMLEQRCLISAFYIVTDPERPIWKVEIMTSQRTGFFDPSDHRNGYRVVIDALTGVVVEEGELLGPFDGKSVLEDALWRY